MTRSCISPSPPGSPGSVSARGFTLVELLVVIVDPGDPDRAACCRRSTRRIAHGQERGRVRPRSISWPRRWRTSRAKYGDYPPSRVLLIENGNYSRVGTNQRTSTADTNDITLGQLAQRSLIAPAEVLPEGRLQHVGPRNQLQRRTEAGFWYDFNGNGITMDSGPYILQGHECLVFFLGGIPLQDPIATGSFGMTASARTRSIPFTNSVDRQRDVQRQPAAACMFEFNAGRLFLDPNNPATLNG